MEAPTLEVVFISAVPLDADRPDGFVRRHRALVDAVAQRNRTRVVFLADDRGIAASAPPAVADVLVVPAARARTDLLTPRQSSGARLTDVRRSLLVPLTPNCAHLAHGHRSVVLLEEGWERALGDPSTLRERLVFAAERSRYRILYRRLGRRANTVIAITERERDHFARYMPLERIAVVPYGVDLEYFRPRPPSGEFDIVVVGAVSQRRGQRIEEFVAAVQSRRPNTRIALVGHNPRETVRSLASPTVTVTGHVEDVRPYYAASKLAVVPTIIDVGVKTTLLQAWAMERAVVATPAAAGAVPNGPVLSAASAGSLADAALFLLDADQERERRAAGGLDYVRRGHDLKVTTTALVTIIEQALGGDR